MQTYQFNCTPINELGQKTRFYNGGCGLSLYSERYPQGQIVANVISELLKCDKEETEVRKSAMKDRNHSWYYISKIWTCQWEIAVIKTSSPSPEEISIFISTTSSANLILKSLICE